LYAVQQGMFLKPNILPAGQFLAKRPVSHGSLIMGFPWSPKILCFGVTNELFFSNYECFKFEI